MEGDDAIDGSLLLCIERSALSGVIVTADIGVSKTLGIAVPTGVKVDSGERCDSE